MSDVLLPGDGAPPAVPPRLAHPGASRHAVAAYTALPVPRLPASALGNERDLRRAGHGDRAALHPSARGIPTRVPVPGTRPSLRPLRTHRGSLDVCTEPWG